MMNGEPATPTERELKAAGAADNPPSTLPPRIEEGEEHPASAATTSLWLPLHEAVSKTVETIGQSVEVSLRKILQAAGASRLPFRGRGTDGHMSPIPADQLCDRSAEEGNIGAIDWHNGESPPTLRDDTGTVAYGELEVEGNSFGAWLYLTKPERAHGKLSGQYVGVAEALVRLRRHVRANERRAAGSNELAGIVARTARSGRLKIWWLDGKGHAMPIDPECWGSKGLPGRPSAEELILNGAIKGKRASSSFGGSSLAGLGTDPTRKTRRPRERKTRRPRDLSSEMPPPSR